MDYSSLPIIVILCYLICEIYKILFKEKQEKYKYIPLLSSVCGGLLGILIYYTDKQIIFNVNSVWIALSIGIVSGASSTGANQIINKANSLLCLGDSLNIKIIKHKPDNYFEEFSIFLPIVGYVIMSFWRENLFFPMKNSRQKPVVLYILLCLVK